MREKVWRAFKTHSIWNTYTIWLKLIECVIEQIAVYGSEVWGPQNKISPNRKNTALKPSMQSSVRLSYMYRGKLQTMLQGRIRPISNNKNSKKSHSVFRNISNTVTPSHITIKPCNAKSWAKKREPLSSWCNVYSYWTKTKPILSEDWGYWGLNKGSVIRVMMKSRCA
jgi:hypothetical protein